MRRLKFFIKRVMHPFVVFSLNLVTIVLNLFVRKNSKVIIVGGWFGKRFADNSRYFFLYLNKHKAEYGLTKVIWITRRDEIYSMLKKEGFDVAKAWSLKSIYYHLKAKYHVIDQSPEDINGYFSLGSVRINLWHGFPLKKIGKYVDTSSGKSMLTEILKRVSRNIHNVSIFSIGGWSKFCLLTTSKFSAEILGYAFNVRKSDIVIANYPRNDVLMFDMDLFIPEDEKRILELANERKLQGYKVIVYLPTFRDGVETLFLNIMDEEEMTSFLSFLEENRIFFITKFHFANTFIQHADVFGDINRSNTLLNLPSNLDVYNLLKLSDMLITDYSSVYFDYLLLNRPILFYPYDLDYYVNKDRGLIFDYDEYTPGRKAYTLEELTGEIKSIIANGFNDGYQSARNRLKNRIFEIEEKPGSHYIIEFLKKYQRM
ncbi:MAG: hypothetical protein GX468_06850 [Thermotogaceae bacterium]|nr:hypothetical protein [Thermotogaceae bacterium]